MFPTWVYHLFSSRTAFTSQYRHLPLLNQVAMPFYLTHQQVSFIARIATIVSLISGACGSPFRRPLGALPQHLPKYLAPCHHCHLPPCSSDNQAGPNKVAKHQLFRTRVSVPGTCLACLPQKAPGCPAMLAEASFLAFILQLLQSYSFPPLTYSTHTVIVKTAAVNKD